MKKSHFRAIIAIIIIIINLSISNVSAFSGLNFTKIINTEKSSATILFTPTLTTGEVVEEISYLSVDHTTSACPSGVSDSRIQVDITNPSPYSVKVNSPAKICFYVRLRGFTAHVVGQSVIVTPSELEYINADFSYGVDKTTELESYSDNSNDLTIKFDRPVTNNDSAGNALAMANFSLTTPSPTDAPTDISFPTPTFSGNTVTINPINDLADGEYSLSISNVKDSAGNIITKRTRKFIIARPVVVSIAPDVTGSHFTSSALNNLSVTFDKPVKLASGAAITDADISKIIKFDTPFDAPITGSISTNKQTINFSLVNPNHFQGYEEFAIEVVSSQLISETSGYAVNGSNIRVGVYLAPITYTIEPLNNLSDNLVITLSESLSNQSGLYNENNKAGVSFGDANGSIPADISISNSNTNTTPNNNVQTYTINPTNINLEEKEYILSFSQTTFRSHKVNFSISFASIDIPIKLSPSSSFSVSTNELIFNNEPLRIYFNEDVYSNATKTAFTSTTLASLITLKTNDASGTDIAFSATAINNKQFVINTTNNLPTGDIYLSISNDYYNTLGFRGSANNVTFEIEAATNPKPIFTPKSHINNSTPLTLNFDREIFADASGTIITSKSILTFKENNSSGEDIPFDAYFNNNREIVLDPATVLTNGDYYIAIDNNYYDSSGTRGVATEFTFSVASTKSVYVDVAPSIIINPITPLTASPTSLTVTFSEPIVLSRNRGNISNSDINNIIRLRKFPGDFLSVTGSISDDKRTITVIPPANLENSNYLLFVNSFELDSLTLGYDVLANVSSPLSSDNPLKLFQLAADITKPTAIFSIAGGATIVDGTTTIQNQSSNIEITFSESVYSSSSSRVLFDATTLASLITLKQDNASGADIAFSATISGNVVTINPTADLPVGNVYLAISTGYHDSSGNTGDADSATFEVEDTTKPTAIFSIAGGATIVDGTTTIQNQSSNIEITFSESVYSSSSSRVLFDATTLASLITLKQDNASGADIAFSATISGNVVTINPTDDLPVGNVYLAISTGYHDSSGNTGDADSATFEVEDTTKPTAIFSIAGGATIVDGTTTIQNQSSNIEITFSESVYSSSSSRVLFDATTLASLITLKQDNASGADIAFSATISGNVVTINPTDDLPVGNVYLAISTGYHDSSGNTGDADSATFEVEDTTKPTAIFSIAGGATIVDGTTTIQNQSSNIEITFSESVYSSSSSRVLFDATTLASLITLKQDNASGADIAFSATISGNVVTINPTADLPVGNVYLAISTGYHDSSGNTGDADSATFEVRSNPIVTFSPSNNSISLPGFEYVIVDNTHNIFAIFNQPVYTTSDASQTVFTDLTIDNIITLKTTDASGADIPFDATISGNIVTINPTSNLAEGKVYVAFDNNYYNYNANATPTFIQGSASEKTYIVNSLPLTVEFTLQSVSSNDANILATFSEEIFADSSLTPFTDLTIDNIIELKVNDNSGADIAFDATISGNVVTINPTSALPAGFIYASVSKASFYDKTGRVASGSNYTFISGTFPTVSVNSPTTEGDLIFTFSEAVYSNGSNAVFTPNNIKSVLTLKENNSSGPDVPFTASINANNNVINLNPNNNLTLGQSYYIKLNSYYYNQAGVSGISYVSTQDATASPTTPTPTTPTPTPPSSGGGGSGGSGGFYYFGFYYVDGEFISDQIIEFDQTLTDQQRILIIELAIIEILEELINIYIEKIRLAVLAS